MNQEQEHLDVCRKFPVHCTNKCGLKDIPRAKLEVHVRDECPATEVQCEYKNLGCEAVFPRSNAKSHSETQVKSHLNLALRGLKTTQHGLETTQHQVRALVSLVKDQSQKIERLEKDMSTVKDQSQEMGRLMSIVKEQSKQIERMNYAPFVWKIPNFQAIYDRAVAGEEEVILSEPFYLSKNGYKLRIKLMPNGGSIDPTAHWIYKGHNLSLYIKVVPGEYDSVLQWPFTEKVRVTLINQDPLDTRKNISRVIDFKLKEDPCLRPLVDKDEGYGSAAFARQNILRIRSYIKNDTIFIMASKEE
ncbi:TNF receptor-associated factor 4 [Desmophyllum pertusum]|uniref:TNF receptor-associated factor 4 n=1 Tax=Desmophyllum pertusum TaxID=174260 RepID=A0A9W9YJL8_9CNID|nr:TNF receptor-associated factor 4 [Desmophyllum pertusum]